MTLCYYNNVCTPSIEIAAAERRHQENTGDENIPPIASIRRQTRIEARQRP